MNGSMDVVIIQQKIFEIRDQRVMLDFDIAEIYNVETRIVNQAVKRNLERFPEDFMFRLTKEEWEEVRLKAGTTAKNKEVNSSQTVMSLRKNRGDTYLPYAFTEHGITMLASVLRSEKAIKMNIAIVRAFIALRKISLHYKELSDKLAELEKQTNKQFKDIYEALNYLVEKKQKEDEFETRERIGFKK